MKQAVVIEKLGYDKEVGDMCIFCLRSTGNENIPVLIVYRILYSYLKWFVLEKKLKHSKIINYNSVQFPPYVETDKDGYGRCKVRMMGITNNAATTDDTLRLALFIATISTEGFNVFIMEGKVEDIRFY
jgi:hypothetical protein